jgi:hypothetical protein
MRHVVFQISCHAGCSLQLDSFAGIVVGVTYGAVRSIQLPLSSSCHEPCLLVFLMLKAYL